MSDREDPRVPETTGKSEAERREFGRQLAMDSILSAAHRVLGDAEKHPIEMDKPAATSVATPAGQRWSYYAATAAVVLIATGAMLWVGLGDSAKQPQPSSTVSTTGMVWVASKFQDSTTEPHETAQLAATPRRDDWAFGAKKETSGSGDSEEPTDTRGLSTGQSNAQGKRLPQSKITRYGYLQSDQPARFGRAEYTVNGAKQDHSKTIGLDAYYKAMSLEVRRMKEAPEGLRIPAPPTSPPRESTQGLGQLEGKLVRGIRIIDTNGYGLGLRTKALHAESYDRYIDNAFSRAKDNQLSTFSIDVDTASYTNIRDLLKRGQTPSPDAVRIEEMVNYFDYKYASPTGEHPLAIHVDMARAPWAPNHHLVRIGLQARKPQGNRPKANLVFLIDVSGSMSPDNKLPLLKRCMKRLVAALDRDDRIAIVVYAGAAGLALDSTPVSEGDAILSALERLKSGGSTNGGAGIELAYKIAQGHFIDGGINRVILASDGDFNVGVSDRSSLIKMIEQKRDTGIFLSVLGFGRGNLKDSQMEQIANKGNGTYNYIDSLREGHRVLVRKLDSSLVTIAKDVKIQVEFNPTLVRSYRLIGYANRMLAKEDFNNDSKDAGEVGSGHTVTALYEVVTVDAPTKVDALRYSDKPKQKPEAAASEFAGEMMFVKVRYKQPDGNKSILLDTPFQYQPTDFTNASNDFRFAAAVASFGMVLRNSPHKGDATLASILEIAEGAMGDDEDGYRNEFLQLLTPLQDKR